MVHLPLQSIPRALLLRLHQTRRFCILTRDTQWTVPSQGLPWAIQRGVVAGAVEGVQIIKEVVSKGGRGRKWAAQNGGDRRARNDAEAEKRRKLDDATVQREKPVYAVEYSKEEIEAEERRPKRKVAVMIGYSGSGYKGMQLSDKEKTIEGDLFGAFVAAGAVSKANANDPKKSALVRCARTDKGVHAAGNVISMKLIIEDEDIVKKINDNLPPQIRVWGFERTTSSFSAYQFCDSRIYEYLIPSHCFLPPHPESFLGKNLVELAEKAGDLKGHQDRQNEVMDFWSETDKQYIQPILDTLEPSVLASVLEKLHQFEPTERTRRKSTAGDGEAMETESSEKPVHLENENPPLMEKVHPTEAASGEFRAISDLPNGHGFTATLGESINDSSTTLNASSIDSSTILASEPLLDSMTAAPKPKKDSPVEADLKEVKAAYMKAKKAYRIPTERMDRIKSALSLYVGTQNFHNYTVQKDFRDASAKRIIKSFILNETPVLVNDTEWLSLKVHGQSFMMHQIRKMVNMVALVVRCGADPSIIRESYGADRISIPKAPGLGLLLERPVFDSYNTGLAVKNERGSVGFEKYEKEMEVFKQREIYERIFAEEERDHQFQDMFFQIDNIRSRQMLYLSSMGIAATKESLEGEMVNAKAQEELEGLGSDDEEKPEDS